MEEEIKVILIFKKVFICKWCILRHLHNKWYAMEDRSNKIKKYWKLLTLDYRILCFPLLYLKIFIKKNLETDTHGVLH